MTAVNHEQTLIPTGRAAILFANHPPSNFELLTPGKPSGVQDLVFSSNFGWHLAKPGMNSKIFIIARKNHD